MITIRGDQIDRLKAEAYKVGFEAYDSVPTQYTEIFDVIPSNSAYTQDNKLVGLSDFVKKPEGDPITFQKPGSARVIYGKNNTFATGIEFSKEAVDDYGVEGVSNVMREYMAETGEVLRRTKEKYAADIFYYGGYTSGNVIFNNSIPGKFIDPSGDLIYDGKPFFNLSNNTRASLNGGTYYNGHALALSDANLKTVWSHQTSTSAYNENDEKISVRPTHLIIPPGLKFTADNILQATNILGSGNNDLNTAKGLVQPIVWDYLRDSDAWFIGVPKKGLKWSEREGLVVDFYQDPVNKNYYATATARWGAWVNDWRPWAGSQFSTS